MKYAIHTIKVAVPIPKVREQQEDVDAWSMEEIKYAFKDKNISVWDWVDLYFEGD